MNRTSNQYRSNNGNIRVWVVTFFLLLFFAVVKGLTGESDTYVTTPEETGYEVSDTVLQEIFNENFVEISYTFRKNEYLEEHYEKHGEEFDYASAQEYLEGANRVLNSAEVLCKQEAEDGDLVYYLESTNELVIVSTDGYIRTYFRPEDGIDYFNRK